MSSAHRNLNSYDYKPSSIAQGVAARILVSVYGYRMGRAVTYRDPS